MNETTNKEFTPLFKRRVRLGIYVLIAIAIIGIIIRIVEYLSLWYSTEDQSAVTVAVITVSRGPLDEKFILPGNVVAWHETTLFARTNGYVVNWYADIGSQVKQGDVLADIAAPEVNSQLRQTEAQLKTAEANYDLARITAARWLNLLKTHSVSQQEADEKVSDEKALEAVVLSTRANRDRLRDLVSFQKVVAPFNGIITSRTTDIGRLINAGSGTVPLFHIVEADKLRIYVRVPQYYASRITPELTGMLNFPQHPDLVYTAKLLDTAKAIDPRTRTLLIQLVADNPSNILLAGSYASVTLDLPTQKNTVRIPVNTLIFQAKGMQVATLTKDNIAQLKSITIGRDFGNDVEVVAGLTPGERIILNPPDSLVSGEKVRVAQPKPTEKGKNN